MVNLKDLKLDLPKMWKEASRFGSEDQVVIRIYHISPLAGINPKIFQERVISETPQETVVKRGVTPASRQPLSGFYDSMKVFIESGLMPPEWNMQKLDKLWKGMTETPMAEHPGRADFSGEITVAKYKDEETAEQTLKNYGLMPTKGFDIPMPGIKIPGMPKDVTMAQYLESDALEAHLKDHASKEDIEKMRKAIREVQEQMPEVAKDLAKSGVKYQEKKYLNCQAIMAGTKSSECYQAIRVKNFVIIGMLLMTAKTLPSGNTPCDSLTKYASEPVITRSEFGILKEYFPKKSNYAREGYITREETEGILKKLIAGLSG